MVMVIYNIVLNRLSDNKNHYYKIVVTVVVFVVLDTRGGFQRLFFTRVETMEFYIFNNTQIV